MIKSILGGKSKNLFDISKSNTNSRNYFVGDLFYCNTYGFNMGTVQQLCPLLKAGDIVILTMWCIKKYKTGPMYFVFGDHRGTIQLDNGMHPLMSSFTITESDLSKSVYIYNQNYGNRDVPFELISRIQLEYGTTRTEYVPHELTSYKSIMKVSDVCQLLDKSKYPATHTKLGCTFTNNGDGSFTINGTIQNGGSWSEPLQQITQNLYGHKILLLTNSTSDIVRGEMKFTLQNGSSEWGSYNSIYTVIYDDYKYVAIRIFMHTNDTGKTIDNATVKFQLFDLTEMFGAGNEPKTVAEFKAKFPNDYYPYSPSCFVTSYDERMPCKTKNLFDPQINLWEARISALNYDNGIYYTKDYASRIIDLTNVDTDYQLSFQIKHRDRGTEYPYSASWNLLKDGKMIDYGKGSDSETFVKLSYTLTLGSTYTLLIYNSIYLGYVQLEKGTTATDYVPYGYV